MAARVGVGGEPVDRLVVGEVQSGDHEHRVASRGRLGRHARPFAAQVVQLAGVDDPHLTARVEGAAVAGVEDAVVGDGSGSPSAVARGGCLWISHLPGVE